MTELPTEVQRVGNVEIAIEALGFDKKRVMAVLGRGAQLQESVLRRAKGEPHTAPTESDDRAAFILHRNVSRALATYERNLLAAVQQAAAGAPPHTRGSTGDLPQELPHGGGSPAHAGIDPYCGRW